MVRTINDHGFSEQVLEASGYVGVAFLDHFSIPCDHFRPELEALADQLGEKVRFYQVDATESPSLAEYVAIEAVPTLVLYRDGEECARYEGPYSREALQERIVSLMREAGHRPKAG
jgi:thioredoxin 1